MTVLTINYKIKEIVDTTNCDYDSSSAQSLEDKLPSEQISLSDEQRKLIDTFYDSLQTIVEDITNTNFLFQPYESKEDKIKREHTEISKLRDRKEENIAIKITEITKQKDVNCFKQMWNYFVDETETKIIYVAQFEITYPESLNYKKQNKLFTSLVDAISEQEERQKELENKSRINMGMIYSS